jgi:peroxiredoxin
MPNGLPVGTKVPDFTLNDQTGAAFQLSKKNKANTVILIFYQGQWCPYCNQQLKGLTDSMNLIVEKGATVVAVTPETLESVEKTIEKTKATFPVLSDNDLKVMTAYLVAFAVDATTVDRYKKFNIDLEKSNGNNGANLPVPAVYIIKNGTIVWRYFDVDYKKRPSVYEIVSKL